MFSRVGRVDQLFSGRFARMFTMESAPLRRSYLYVPSSSKKMLQKSLSLDPIPDVVVYDLEDSVAPSAKLDARRNLSGFLNDNVEVLGTIRQRATTAVRVNDIRTEYFHGDIKAILKADIRILVMPKIHTAEDLSVVAQVVQENTAGTLPHPIQIVASIESARAMYNIGSIASFRTTSPNKAVSLSGLLFAAEDYCADTSVIRTSSRQELLYPRSQIVITAKAFGLEAIDLVCVDYQNPQKLIEECTEGRRLGFTGKQAIHPSQVETIQSTFVPTSAEIQRATKILEAMEAAHGSNSGAVGLEGQMMDAPMVKQAERTIALAKKAGLV